jgi:hypothetical protein
MDILTSTMESLTTTTDTLTSTMESLTTTDTLTTTIPYISLFLLLTTSLIQALLSVQTTQHEAKIAKLQAKSDAALTKVRLDSAESNRRANFELETKERVIEEGEAKDKKITNLKNFVAAQTQKLAAEKNRMAAKEQESCDLAMQVRHKANMLRTSRPNSTPKTPRCKTSTTSSNSSRPRRTYLPTPTKTWHPSGANVTRKTRNSPLGKAIRRILSTRSAKPSTL